MANLWRVLALSWLGGIGSPALTGDIFPGELGRILREEIQRFPGVRATRTQVVLNTVKETRRIDLDAKEEVPA